MSGGDHMEAKMIFEVAHKTKNKFVLYNGAQNFSSNK